MLLWALSYHAFLVSFSGRKLHYRYRQLRTELPATRSGLNIRGSGFRALGGRFWKLWIRGYGVVGKVRLFRRRQELSDSYDSEQVHYSFFANQSHLEPEGWVTALLLSKLGVRYSPTFKLSFYSTLCMGFAYNDRQANYSIKGYRIFSALEWSENYIECHLRRLAV